MLAYSEKRNISNMFREISVSKFYHKITGVHNVIAKAVFKCGIDV
jgi:hypothetical protein